MFEDKIKTSNLLAATLQQINSAANQFQNQFLSSWEKTHKSQLEAFLEIQKTCLQKLNQLIASDFHSSALWRELETTIEQLLEQTESLQYIDDDGSTARFREAWKERFHETLKDVPPSFKRTIPKKYWQARVDDSARIRLWKGLKKSQIWLAETTLNLLNKVRTLFRKPPLPPFRIKRTIPVHSFLDLHYNLPIARFLLEAWQKFLQQIAIQLYQMHETTEETVNELLCLEDLKAINLEHDAEKLIPKLQKAKERLPSLDSFFESLEKYKAENKEQFESYVRQLQKDIEHDWEYAGTYILPNRKFTGKKITPRWTSLDRVFDKSKNAWVKHFNGEREDWNKDLELSHLQVRISQICVETLHSIKSKINDQVLPAFTEPNKMLADSLQKFQEISVKKEAELRSEILTENRLMLRSLRQEKLPHTIDTLLQAQLLKTLDNYLSRVKHAAENLPNQHRIFRRQDLKGLPPDSEFVDISLKDLVLEEIYRGLAQEYETFTKDVQHRLDKIVREIAETDQIVEFNLEAALELLEKSKEADVLEEAQKVVIEGLERAQSQLDGLVEQIQQVAELSQETLLQTTFEFESQVRQLADNEKIMALKLRLAKAKTQEELRGYRKKVLWTIKSAFPSVLSVLTGYLKKFQSRYSRLRRITGLEPVTADVEERLSQFILGTEKRIVGLPYVYERLFRIHPLSDERFFEGRNADLERIKQEFDLWQAGQYGVTALVGEKGSGKTTLLNFATKQVFNKFPVLRIELAGYTISTEEGLFLFFKDIFQEKEIGNLDELENKLMTLDSQKVIIVEDIQNLFLRTVDSFEALERFLLLVSRTHEKIYWIMTCTLYSWRYIDKVINISKFIQRAISLGGLTSEDIENIVLKRHRVSGYKLLFEATQDIVNSKKFKKLTTDESRQKFLKDIYFRQLNDLAAGNISVTMMFWLSAINKIEQDTMIMSLARDHNFSFLSQLPADELFTLAALLQHEMMTVEEHAQVFHQDIRQSLLLLNRMTNRGILYEKSNGNYQVNFLLYRAVVQALSMKNILH